MLVLTGLDGLGWLLLTLAPLLFLQRVLHREIQAVLLMITRHPGLTVGVFSLFFFPGVILHELSHFIMAKLLRVPTGRVSFIPQTTSEGYLQLGYVETAKSDIVRDSLIGAAPIISGGLFIAYAAIFHLDLLPLWDVLRNGQVGLFILGLGLIPKVKDFLPWLYLTFAVSSTMLPSASDRYAWRPVGLWILVLLVLAILAGAGPWMLAYLAPWVNAFLRSAALVFGLSALVHLVLLLPFFLFHRVLTRLTGIDVGQ